MFEFQKIASENYTWPVVVKVPTDGGKSKEFEVEAIFKRIGKKEITRLLESVSVYNDKKELVEMKYNIVLDAVLVGLKGKSDAGKMEAMPSDIKDLFLDLAGADIAIFTAYTSSISGVKVKN